ncbi:hypothetical protein [Nonomuraea indica]|uniref:hypothetical protein n=1 Tax=Nonomuraea indica TaxID=1581193 RepID=UPI0015DF0411|nr:hypothetical protein [Nonomuraea indica]
MADPKKPKKAKKPTVVNNFYASHMTIRGGKVYDDDGNELGSVQLGVTLPDDDPDDDE